MQPVIPDIGALGVGSGDLLTVSIALGGSLVLSLVVAFVYKWTHRGLSYSQSFQFSLVLLGMLGSVIMIIASGSLLRAIGILGAFSLIRFRTAVKDPKDMAYILFVLAIGMAMGAGMYELAVATAVVVSLVILVLTWTNFGMAHRHESVLRILSEGTAASNAASIEAILADRTAEHRLLSAHAHGDRMEFSYGVRPKKGDTSLALLDTLRAEKGVEHAEFFDAKHQVEF